MKGGMYMRISSMSYLSRQNNRNLSRSYQKLSSGKRINSAADNAAGLAIAKKLLKQSNGMNVGINNSQTSQNMINVAEGAMGSVNDALQRIRELSIQASNGTYSASDKEAIQTEIDQLKQSIGGTASQTQFNEMKLLDGSMGSSHVASDANGGGMDISMPKFSLEALGIADFDVTKSDFDISAIDKALEKVNSSRSYLGASSNRLDHTMAYGANAVYNLTASQSRIEDLNYAHGVSDMKKEQLLNTYTIMMQRKYMDNESGRVKQFFN